MWLDFKVLIQGEDFGFFGIPFHNWALCLSESLRRVTASSVSDKICMFIHRYCDIIRQSNIANLKKWKDNVRMKQ